MRWSTDTRRCSRSLKHAAKEHIAKSKPGSRWLCRNRTGSRCERRSSVTAGRWRSTTRGCGSFSIKASAAEFEKLNAAIQQINATDPGRPRGRWWSVTRRSPIDPHVFMRGNPGRPGAAIPRQFLKVLSSERTPCLQERQRPARAGPGDRDRWQPADRSGLCEPRLALAFRQGIGRHSQRLRRSQRSAVASRAARLTSPTSSSSPAGRSRPCTAESCSRIPTSSE